MINIIHLMYMEFIYMLKLNIFFIDVKCSPQLLSSKNASEFLIPFMNYDKIIGT